MFIDFLKLKFCFTLRLQRIQLRIVQGLQEVGAGQMDRQRVTIGRLGTDAINAEQQAESRMWAARARAYAEGGEWREAVHALYWASIVALEDRRTLRRSGTRTPREALRLIDPASHLREPLRAQTGEFERIWYGLRPAGREDYARVLALYEEVRAA